jgi:ribosomal protein S18 acetylase RimI-like enzyme
MIREYKQEDLSTIMDIANRAWQGIYDMYLETYGEELFSLVTPDRYSVKGEQIKSHAQKHPDWLYVCEEDGKIVGFVTIHIDAEKKIGEIGNNAVDPTCGLKGIGQQMYKAALERFSKEGMKYAKVGTGLDPAHAPARRAYERAGFNIKTESVMYYKRLG